MPVRKRPSAVETLACWLNGAARAAPGRRDVLRQIVRLAAEDAAGLYEDEDEDEYKIRELIGKFAAALDEDEINRTRDGL